MVTRFKEQCPVCGACLMVVETNGVIPSDVHMENNGLCPVCNAEIYKSLTNGSVQVYEISEEEFKDN